nr:hypothetical protein [Tanacetum cinerariifolium]
MARDVQRMNEQITRDAEIARIHAEEELQMMINSLDRNNETVVKQLCKSSQIPESAKKATFQEAKEEYYMSVITSHSGWKTKGFNGMTFEEIEAKFTTVWKQIEDFVPMGSKEEAERVKRKGLRLEQESVKKLKTLEEVPKEMKEDLNQLWALVKESLSIRPATNDKKKELWVELKRLYEPDVKDQLWTHTQTMMHAPVEWKLYDMCGVHHVISKD